MKIAILTPAFPPYRGGMGRVAEMDAEALLRLGHEPVVFSLLPKGGSKPAPQGYEFRELRPWPRYGLGGVVFGIAKRLQEFDVVLLHYPFFGVAEFVALAKSHGHLKVPLLLFYHMDIAGFGRPWLKAVSAIHTPLVMPQIVATADRIIGTSLDYLRSCNLADFAATHASRLIALPPSVDIERFAPAPKSLELLNRYGLKETDRVISFVGGMDAAHYFKGIPVLLLALSRPELAGVKCVLAGDGDNRLEFERLSIILGLEDRVTFAGSASEEELPDHYRLGDVFAFPSTDKSEAFGIVALEALSCGVPVVASDLPGVRTIVRDGMTGRVVPAEDVESLARALAAVLNDSQSRSHMSSAARHMATTEYSEPARDARWKMALDGLS